MKNVNFQIHKALPYMDYMHQMRGELEIWGSRGGKVFYHDKGPNAVTIWAKHANMHLLTGEVFTNKGVSRNDGTHNGDTNSDGTIVSGKQFLTGDSLDWWANDDTGVASMDYGFFPTKLLFGTGKEFASWASMSAAEQTYYATSGGGGWTQSDFDDNISDANNSYSNAYTGDTLLNRKSINDVYASTLVTPVVTDEDFGVQGAVKNSLYKTSIMPGGDSAKLELVSGKFFPTNSYKGVGFPCFLYPKRDSRFAVSGTEVGLSFDSHVENKITFTISLPEQTGANAGKYYPYNGYTLKVAGLFCDARFMLSNTQPTQDSESDDNPLEEYDNWTKMPYGIMYAKRYIAPITKSHDLAITARWTLYL